MPDVSDEEEGADNMIFVIGDIVKIGPYTGTVTRFFSDDTIGVDDNRVDPTLFRIDIIGHIHNAWDKPYNGCKAILHVL